MDADETRPGWCPLTGQRTFRSANQAWEIYGQYRFSVAKRTFLSWVGKDKLCAPGEDGLYHVEDIEIISKARGWPPTPSFAGGITQGGAGGNSPAEIAYAEMFQQEKALKERAIRKQEEIKLQKMTGEVMLREDYEQNLAAAALVVGTAAETWVYDSVREIIHTCGGNPAKEDELRDWLLLRVRGWLNGFAAPKEYEVDLLEDEGPEGFGAVAGTLPAPDAERA